MMSKEYCRYIRTYSELEGLQHAHTLRYLCENSVGLEQWLDVLDDAGQSYELLENAGETGMVPDFTGKNLEFCAICRF